MIPKYLFIINPVAGHNSNRPDEALIDKVFEGSGVDVRIMLTKSAGHAFDLATEAVDQGYQAVIAVGGDGTVNEVARGLYGTQVKLGIVPCGSGNGLARHHKIPLEPKGALEIIRNGKAISHDVLRINDKLSFNVSGIGFDARVAHLFGGNGQRGLSGYLKLIIQEFRNYPQHDFKLTYDGTTRTVRALFIALGNASQYGNGARITPVADTGDGTADFTIVKRMHGALVPAVALRVFNGSIGKSKYAETFSAKYLTIECDPPAPLHIDGEDANTASRYVIACEKSKLQLIVAQTNYEK